MARPPRSHTPSTRQTRSRPTPRVGAYRLTTEVASDFADLSSYSRVMVDVLTRLQARATAASTADRAA